MLCACGELEKELVDASTDGLTDSSEVGDVIYVDSDCPALRPTHDDDNDGLSNGLEDRNRNCQVDEGETDPKRDDTDGDGLLDGDEDINRNGLVDVGETDPRLYDTDGDGTPDGAELSALICTPSLLEPLSELRVDELTLLLPKGFAGTAQTFAHAALFENLETSSFGFLAASSSSDSSPLVVLLRYLAKLDERFGLEGEQVALHEFSSLADRALGMQSARLGVQAQFVFRLGAATPNPDIEVLEPAELRDHLLSVVSAETADATPTSAPCARLTLFASVQLQPSESQQVVMAVSCDAGLSESTRFALEDLSNGSALLASEPPPQRFWCGKRALLSAPSKLDVLWVIDNSPSMAGKLEPVSAAARRTVDVLQATGADWRIAVTTTESYLLDSAPSLVAHDALLDTCSGLRGDGFLSAQSENARTSLEKLLSFDPYCEPPHAALFLNLCGHKRESGLRSARTALLRATSQSCSESHRWRSDARRVVFWASNEEDQLFKFDDDFSPSAADDPRRLSQLSRSVEGFLQQRVLGCAIVGDEGIAAGGLCPALSSEFSVEGAQHGLGYIEVARATGGTYGSICSSTLDTVIDACLLRSLYPIPQVVLPHSPISATLRVVLDGEILPRSTRRGWFYDAASNSILFAGMTPELGAGVSVAYQTWATPTP